jgi:D-glycero-D-manno-heptose 1,7-bisphosphate phosphatase
MRTHCAFLDRDGVLNVRPVQQRYITRPDELELLPRAGEAVRLLNEAGFTVVVVTNQRGISLGLYDDRVLEAIHERLRRELDGAGARLDAIYHCPHHENDRCACRKPNTGMFLEAARDFPGLDFTQSVVIGDSFSDLLPGHALGCRTVLVGANAGNAEGTAEPVAPDFRCQSLWEAVTEFVLPGMHSSASLAVPAKDPGPR